jgi:hypothetical protein
MTMTIPSPIELTDSQMTAVLAAATPLLPNRRSKFLADVARELARLPNIGDGAVHLVIVQVQKRYFDPPTFDRDNGASKWSRRGRPRRDDDDSEDDQPRRKAQPRSLGAL